MLANGATFVNLLRAFYALYAIAFSHRSTNYQVDKCVYDLCSSTFFTSILFVNDFVGTQISTEVIVQNFEPTTFFYQFIEFFLSILCPEPPNRISRE